MNKTMKKWLYPILMIVLAIGLLSGCGSKDPDQSEVVNPLTSEQATTNEANQETVSEQSAFPVTFTDADGVEITIEKQPERIVSLLPSNTEIAYALGAGDAVIGISDYDNYPPGVETKEKVGGLELNVEKILSLNPDLVLAHASGKFGWEAALQQLTDAGIKVVMIQNETSFAEVYQSIEMIAKATGYVANGEQMINEMKATVADFEQKASAISEGDQALVWVEVDPTLFTTGKGTFINEMLEILHAKNIAGEQDGWVQYTEEDVVHLNPDVILTTYGDYVENPAQQILARPAWQEVKAVKDQRVFDVDADMVTRTGPRLTKGLEELAKAIYPEIFAK